jgi:hypothetical protein
VRVREGVHYTAGVLTTSPGYLAPARAAGRASAAAAPIGGYQSPRGYPAAAPHRGAPALSLSRNNAPWES